MTKSCKTCGEPTQWCRCDKETPSPCQCDELKAKVKVLEAELKQRDRDIQCRTERDGPRAEIATLKRLLRHVKPIVESYKNRPDIEGTPVAFACFEILDRFPKDDSEPSK